MTLLGLIVLIAITFALASVSTALTGTVLDALGLSHIGWLRPVLHFVPIIFSIGAGWLLFMYLYTVLPEHREPWPIVRRGALIGAIGLAVLQYATGLLFAAFQSNKAAQLFGPVIVLMLFFNVFAQLILFIAAWIATARHEAIAAPEEKVRFALAPESEREAEPAPMPARAGHGAAADRRALGSGRARCRLRHRRGDRGRAGRHPGLAGLRVADRRSRVWPVRGELTLSGDARSGSPRSDRPTPAPSDA